MFQRALPRGLPKRSRCSWLGRRDDQSAASCRGGQAVDSSSSGGGPAQETSGRMAFGAEPPIAPGRTGKILNPTGREEYSINLRRHVTRRNERLIGRNCTATCQSSLKTKLTAMRFGCLEGRSFLWLLLANASCRAV